jgi:hypothetical protein
VVALAHHTFNAVEKLTECIVRGSRRARSNAAVCVCHITARRHAVSVKVRGCKLLGYAALRY